MKKSSHTLPQRRKNSQYQQRLGVFANTATSQTHDLLRGLADDGSGHDALSLYLKDLDDVFDVSSLERSAPFLTLGTEESLVGMEFVELGLEQLQALLQNALPEFNASDAAQKPSPMDSQIRVDRSDIIARVLKARNTDPSVTVVSGPSTPQ